jgi:hypothetical protein
VCQEPLPPEKMECTGSLLSPFPFPWNSRNWNSEGCYHEYQ